MSTIPTFITTKGGIDQTAQKLIDKGVQEGLFCTKVREPIPTYRNGGCEKVIYQGGQVEPTGGPSNNCFIILGRDRPSHLASGAGGMGQTQCGMIDLVVGRAALISADQMKKELPPIGKEEVVSPSFITDAARIYITQKSLNIDEYFGFANTITPPNAIENKSAIGIKSDHTRIIGRETVRIYCGGAQNVEGLGKDGETNTTGGRLSRPRIDLIAGNEKNLQPAVLGNNLINYLTLVEEEVSSVKRDIGVIMEQLIAVNSSIALLTFGAPPYSSNIKVNIEKWVEQLFGNINSELRRLNALNGLGIIDGADSIVSKSVYVS